MERRWRWRRRGGRRRRGRRLQWRRRWIRRRRSERRLVMVRHPDWVTQFLSEEDLESLAAAVRQAEAKTSAEVRVHLDHTCHEDALPRGIQIFQPIRMHRTAHRNGVLVYISVQDHKLAVIGDKGIHERVGEAYWRD